MSKRLSMALVKRAAKRAGLKTNCRTWDGKQLIDVLDDDSKQFAYYNSEWGFIRIADHQNVDDVLTSARFYSALAAELTKGEK